MSVPKRIQRKRTKGWRMPEGAVYVGRPSRWGNPFTVTPEPSWPRWAGPRPSIVTAPDGEVFYPPQSRMVIVGRAAAERSSRTMAALMAADLFRDLVTGGHMAESFWRPLVGRDLACWYPLEDEHGNRVPCHADVLLEIANRGDDQ